MSWDREKALEHLRKHANEKSIGRCAAYTRDAIEAGGVVLIRHASAKNYGISLLAIGFLPLNQDSGEYLAGDVVVIDGFDDQPHGHMAMFDGSSWISDFVQSALYPGPAYRKNRPKYVVYRHSIR